jgi:hypothetical protein
MHPTVVTRLKARNDDQLMTLLRIGSSFGLKCVAASPPNVIGAPRAAAQRVPIERSRRQLFPAIGAACERDDDPDGGDPRADRLLGAR